MRLPLAEVALDVISLTAACAPVAHSSSVHHAVVRNAVVVRKVGSVDKPLAQDAGDQFAGGPWLVAVRTLWVWIRRRPCFQWHEDRPLMAAEPRQDGAFWDCKEEGIRVTRWLKADGHTPSVGGRIRSPRRAFLGHEVGLILTRGLPRLHMCQQA